MTLETVYNEFVITQKLKGNSEKTISYYKSCISPFIQYFGKDFDISLLSVSNVREYSLHLKDRNISSNSFKTYLKGIKAFLTWIYTEEYIKVNLGEKLKLPKAQRKTIDTLTKNEIEFLFKSFDTKNYLGLRNYCICALMLDSGLRKSEVVALKISDIHIVEGYILVNGKGNKQRIVPIGYNSQKHLIKLIDRIFVRYNVKHGVCGDFLIDCRFVVCSVSFGKLAETLVIVKFIALFEMIYNKILKNLSVGGVLVLYVVEHLVSRDGKYRARLRVESYNYLVCAAYRQTVRVARFG